jgi:hypothetical protein
VGRRRIGLAGCDPLGITVTPLQALARGDLPSDLARLLPLVLERRVELLVVGLPLDSDQQPTRQAAGDPPVPDAARVSFGPQAAPRGGADRFAAAAAAAAAIARPPTFIINDSRSTQQPTTPDPAR